MVTIARTTGGIFPLCHEERRVAPPSASSSTQVDTDCCYITNHLHTGSQPPRIVSPANIEKETEILLWVDHPGELFKKKNLMKKASSPRKNQTTRKERDQAVRHPALVEVIKVQL